MSPDATVADSLRNDVINKLRSTYLDMAAKEAIWSARYGSNHLAAVNLRTQMAELRRSIRDEVGRIAESYKSDYEIAKARMEGLERELQKLVSNSQTTNRDRLGLTDLEGTAKVYRSIYDSFLQRYMEIIQQQSFPITESRVISAATPPEQKSSPKTLVVLGIAGSIGLALSFGLALLREAVDRVFRTTRQVEMHLHTRCLSVLPRLGPKANFSIAASFPIANQPAGAKRSASASVAARSDLAASTRPYMRRVIEDPLSPFSEGFRSIKVAVDLSGSRLIGITSTVPGEGKSTISSKSCAVDGARREKGRLSRRRLEKSVFDQSFAARCQVRPYRGSRRGGSSREGHSHR